MELYNSVPYDESEMKSIESSILSRILNSSCSDYIITVTDVRNGKSDSSEGFCFLTILFMILVFMLFYLYYLLLCYLMDLVQIL